MQLAAQGSSRSAPKTWYIVVGVTNVTGVLINGVTPLRMEVWARPEETKIHRMWRRA
jgi:hypothetical protein